MKKFLIGVVAVAGLLGSVLAVVASTSGPASGQQASITLQNISASNALVRALPAVSSNINVAISPIGGCNPGTRAPLQNGQFALPVSQTDTATDAVAEITGLMSTNCNWEFIFTNPLCEVNVRIRNQDGDHIEEVKGREVKVILSGSNTGGGQLQYNGQQVGYLRIWALLGGADSFTGTNDSTTEGRRCSQTFTSSLSLGGSAVTAAHTGLEITATYTSSTAGCIGGSLVNRITAAGGLEFVSASPAQARDATGALNGVSLLSETIAQKGSPATAASGDRCIYSVAVTDTLGNLRLARNAFGLIDTSMTTNLVDGVAVSGAANPVLAGSTATDIIPANVTITYATYRVAVTVVTTYPADEVFTTDDRVDYLVAVDSPCGGFDAQVIPSNFGAQGDAASTQVFPGSVIVYGNDLNQIQNRVGAAPAKTYDVPAFADARGARACSVTVTERNGPERCSPVGGASQTKTVAAGSAALAFEFNHTCEPVAPTSSGDPDTDDSNGGGPPAPPAIDVGGGDTDTPDGPPDEARAG